MSRIRGQLSGTSLRIKLTTPVIIDHSLCFHGNISYARVVHWDGISELIIRHIRKRATRATMPILEPLLPFMISGLIAGLCSCRD